MSDETLPSIISLDEQNSSFEPIDENQPRRLSKEFHDDQTLEDTNHSNGDNQTREETSPSTESEENTSVNNDDQQTTEETQRNDEDEQTSSLSLQSNDRFDQEDNQTDLIGNGNHFQEKSEEIKPQRQLDEDDIPPPVNNEERRTSSSSSSPRSDDVLLIDERPLTALETPFDQTHEEEEEEQQSLNESDQTNGHEIPPMKLSEFIPDVVHQIVEDKIQSETVENSQTNPEEFTAEDFPPLPPPANLVPAPLYDQEYPPLSTQTPEQSSSTPSEDLLGNRTLFKQTIVQGEENTRPTRSTMVTISYELFLVNTLTTETRLIEKVTNERYFLSENDLIPAIDISLQSMNRGERALIDSDIRHCYGDIGCEEKQIPPSNSLHPYRMKIDLELHQWISPIDIQLLPLNDRLYWGDKKRQMGNFFYRRQEYPNALQSYQGASRFVDIELNPLANSLDETILIDRFIQVQNNIAQVNLLLNNYQACLTAVQHVLKFDPKNVKALFRQGKALFQLGLFEQAIQPLKYLTQINPTNSNDHEKAFEIISICEQKLAKDQKNEKEMYQRMFQTKTPKQQRSNNHSNEKKTNWWPYLALGGAVIAISLFTFMKYREK